MPVISTTIRDVRSYSTIRQVRCWAENRLGEIDHETRVMHLAAGLFELLAPIHKLPGKYRRMVRIAALLHDIGRVGGGRKHHLRGERIIQAATRVDLSVTERAFAAFAAHYHRGPIPSRGRSCDAVDQHTARVLLSLIRAADALDKRDMAPPTIRILRTGKTLRVEILVHRQWRKSRRQLLAKRKFRMLREELGVRTKLRLVHA